MKRRTLLQLAAASNVPLALNAAATAKTTADPLHADTLYAHVQKYTSIGEHRTGTAGDLATSRWIKAHFTRCGLQASTQPVGLNLFEVQQGFLALPDAGYRVDPEWYPTPTAPGGIRAPLRMLREGEDFAALKGCIWVVPVQMRRPVVPAEIKQQALSAARAGAVGVVMHLAYRSQALTGRGAHGSRGQQRWCPIPLVAVAAEHAAVLAAAERGAEAHLVLRGREQEDAQALNVIGEHHSANKPTIVVTTPQSGMFRCGGERGGGIALLLGLAQWVAQRQPHIRYLFATNTGHEQGGSGARVLLENTAPPPEQVVAWLHLGSGVATWRWREDEQGNLQRYVSRGGVQNFGCVPELQTLLTQAFADMPDLTPQSERFAGELRAYVDAGYPGFGFWGYNRYGHTLADGPEQVAPALLASVGRALARALVKIEQTAKA